LPDAAQDKQGKFLVPMDLSERIHLIRNAMYETPTGAGRTGTLAWWDLPQCLT
jgi:hypothetical protein